jgi:FlaA1/EpsC-like NDP-sugar epimerase
MVLVWLQTGILFSLGLALVIDPGSGGKWLLRAFLVAAVSHPIIIISRLIYRSIEEFVLWLKRTGETGETERVLLYGAGLRAQLFLKDRALRMAKHYDSRLILGFIDDESSLHYQWVYGVMVLGGLKELPALIERHNINRIIITSELTPESQRAVQEIAAQGGVWLSEWYPVEHPVSGPAAQS